MRAAIAAGRVGNRADLTFDRKTGRRVEGRVQGLEKAKLRYAFVSIGLLGPEELFRPGDKKARQFTHFDVIPIGPEGRFSTPPLPPNRYEFRLSALLASTPARETQKYDFSGSTWVVVPETGRFHRWRSQPRGASPPRSKG
ncbi:MAG: hypothetical protein WKF75_09855 [Singulisphaera sp.]